ncbi:MAG: transketolase [Chloroflexota bacterium]|nr:transketolase [Chloroflexota bacterium]
MSQSELDRLCANTLRTLAMDIVQKAHSGHPGMPMGTSEMAYVLWTRFLRHNPTNPHWPDRDRFILSAGHGSALLYSLLHLTGYDMPMEELKRFRQWGSHTPGHPEYDLDRGVELTTGPLGQGFATGVGMAIAERFLSAIFNRPGYPIVDHRVYTIVSDGDLMEGISHEAAALAGHLGLDKLIYLYDDNEVSIDGSTNLAFTEDVQARFQAYGWFVQEVDGHDMAAIEETIRTARQHGGKPSLIVCHTHIAYGSPHLQDDSASHGAPLGEEEVRLTKEALGWDPDAHFSVPDLAREEFHQAVGGGKAWEAEWQRMVESYASDYPDLAALWERLMAGQLPQGWRESLPSFQTEEGPMSTRDASGHTLNAMAPSIPELLGGSADLSGSNRTYLHDFPDFSREQPDGRNIHFGVREHTMGAILNGMALHGGIIPYGGTFLVFSDYMRPAIRLAAMMKQPVNYVFTHDSIGIGEDGPTHQPVEHIASLRAIPNLVTIRPADANEAIEAWRFALRHQEGPVALILTRQALPILDPSTTAEGYPAGLEQGAYILADAPEGQPDLILIATGSEVHPALGARKLLAEQGIGARVVSMPSWELFEEQPEAYRRKVLPSSVPVRLAVEAGVSQGWHRYVGKGDVIGVERFGASAPYKVLWEKYGFTAQHIAERAQELLAGWEEGDSRH